MLVTAQTMSKT